MDWAKRINSVLNYIEENLDGEIDDKKIASLFVSPQGMFQRVFANMTELMKSGRLYAAVFPVLLRDEKFP